MKKSIFTLLVLFNLSFYAQEFHDILYYDGEYFLMSENPSIYIADFEFDSSPNFIYGCEYEIIDDSLVVTEVLKCNKKIDDTVGFELVEGDVVQYNGDIGLIKIANYDKTKKEISKKGVYQDFGYLGDYYQNDFKKTLIFEKGKFVPGYYDFHGSLVTEDFGYLRFNEVYYSELYVDVHPHGNFDSVQYEIRIEDYDSYNNYIRLPEGHYDLSYSINEQRIVIRDCSVEINETTIVELPYLYEPYSEPFDDQVYYSSEEMSTSIDYLFGNNKFYQDESRELNSFDVSVYQGFVGYLDARKNIALVSKFGGGYNLSFLHQILDSRFEDEPKLDTYSYAHAGAQFGARFYFIPQLSSWQTRGMVEFGGAYDMPLIFRNVKRFPSEKTSQRGLHNFKDLRGYTKIGVTNGATLTAYYRFFDVVKTDMPQLPKLQIGLSILIDY